jgi:DNA-binding transcriptional regulator GbsR (MarR family)
LAIKIIRATPGPTTTEQLLDLVRLYPQGLTARELSDKLNRPISMINVSLKVLLGLKQVSARFIREENKWVYYPKDYSKARSIA